MEGVNWIIQTGFPKPCRFFNVTIFLQIHNVFESSVQTMSELPLQGAVPLGTCCTGLTFLNLIGLNDSELPMPRHNAQVKPEK